MIERVVIYLTVILSSAAMASYVIGEVLAFLVRSLPTF